MKGNLIYLTVTFCMILSIVPIAASTHYIQAASTLHVGPTGQPYNTIQDAINASAAGDTIIVHDGTYNENIMIDKPLTILSENGSATTIIDGTAGENNPAVGIMSGDVTFGNVSHGFSITHQWDDAVNESSGMGIFVINTDSGELSGVNIQGNYVHDLGAGISGNGPGIALGNLGTGTVCGNNLSGNEVYNCSMGIVLINMNESDIHGNTISGNNVHLVAIPIGLFNFAPGEIYNNEISGNEVYEDCGFSIILSGFGGDIYENLIAGNTISDSFIGIVLGEVGGFSGVSVYDNIVEDNEAYNCGAGVILAIEDTGTVHGNTVQDNIIHDMTPVDTAPGCGIALSSMGTGTIYDNTVENNTVYHCVYGIRLSDYAANGAISNNDILHNIMYNGSLLEGNDYGIRTDSCDNISVRGNDVAYSSNKGICLVSSNYIDITSNTVYNNSEGIYMEGSSNVEIRGNDIRDNNPANATGIAVYNSEYVTATCNNIVGNGVGLYVYYPIDPMTCVYADDNWWGTSDGPSGTGFSGSGDEIYLDGAGCVEIESWLTAQNIINISANPPSIPDNDSYVAVLSVEQMVEEGCCNASSVTVDLSALLMDLLPADFEQRYVSAWSNDSRDDWDDWLYYLSEIGMDYNESENSWNYELDLENLLVDGLMPFFSYGDGDEDYARLIGEELRLGDFHVSAYLHNDDCGTEFRTFIPLTVTTFSPMPTPTPTPTHRPGGGGGYVPPEETATATPNITPTVTPTTTATATPTIIPTSSPVPTGTPGPSTLTISLDTDSTTVEIPSGVEALDTYGQPVDEITIQKTTGTGIPPIPEGYFLIETFDFGPDGTTFTPAVEITLVYDLSQLPAGEAPVIAYYDETAGEWVFVTGTVNIENGTITFSVEHFTWFVVLGSLATPASGGGIAPWVWIVIGLIALLAIALVIRLLIQRRATPVKVKSDTSPEDDTF